MTITVIAPKCRELLGCGLRVGSDYWRAGEWVSEWMGEWMGEGRGEGLRVEVAVLSELT